MFHFNQPTLVKCRLQMNCETVRRNSKDYGGTEGSFGQDQSSSLFL